MNDKTRLGAAIVGGYVLGRTKKGGTALRFALWLNGTSSGALVRERLQRLGGSDQLNRIADLGQPLLIAARKAAVAAVESRLSGLADNLNQRTARLLPQGDGSGRARQTDDEELDEDEDRDERDEEEEAPAARRRQGRRARDEDDEDEDENGDESDDEETPAARRRQTRRARDEDDRDASGSGKGEPSRSSTQPRSGRSEGRSAPARRSSQSSSRSREGARS